MKMNGIHLVLMLIVAIPLIITNLYTLDCLKRVSAYADSLEVRLLDAGQSLTLPPYEHE